MKTYSFDGGSDDLFHWSVENEEGLTGGDEIGCCSRTDRGVNCSVILRSSEGECRVFGMYGLGGAVWGFGISQTEEDKPLPGWPVSIEQADFCKYSSILSIDCPDDTKLIVEDQEEEE